MAEVEEAAAELLSQVAAAIVRHGLQVLQGEGDRAGTALAASEYTLTIELYYVFTVQMT